MVMDRKDEDSYKWQMQTLCVRVYSDTELFELNDKWKFLVSVLYCFEYNLMFSYHFHMQCILCINGLDIHRKQVVSVFSEQLNNSCYS